MEFALTPTKDKGIAGKTPPRHSQETTQPATSQLVELYTQYRERHDNEEELITECMTQYQQTAKGQSTASSTDNQPVLVSVASAQYQQTGECRMAHIVDTAQPTHLISSTEDAVMQLSPDTPRSDAHIATPRLSIGGRCRNWVVSSQDSSSTNKRACAACTICSKQFTPGEHRQQQWSNRDAHRSYVHAHCIKGGLKTSHEFIPKNSKDIDAKEGVLHTRNNVLNAATETGLVLPIYDPHEDNSTVAPDDEDRTFDREEALRFDDKIMDFHWFSSVSWAEIKDLRGTSSGQKSMRCSHSTKTYEDKSRTNRNQDSQGRHSRQSWGERTSSSSGTKRPASPSHPGHSPGDQKPLPRADPDPATPLSNQVTNIFIFDIADYIPHTLKRMPRLSEPGPLGMRAEHWYDFGTLAGDIVVFSLVMAHIATATLPDAVLQYLRAGQVTPLVKPTGGNRPLLMMSFLRRLALKAVIAAKQKSVIEAAGTLQHGVGCKDGANKMIKSI